MDKIIKLFKSWIVNTVCFVLRHTTKIHDNRIVFHSRPDFSDNAKALYKYMMANGYDKKYDIYFAVEDLARCEKQFAGEARFIQFNDKSHRRLNWSAARIIISARYLLYTHSAPFPLTTADSKPGQRHINLWHGSGYKGTHANPNKYTTRFDMVFVPGKLFVEPMMKFFGITKSDPIEITGYPRYDWLLHPSDTAVKAAKHFQSEDANRLVVWMPTFRNDKHNVLNDTECIKQFPIIATQEQWNEVDELCKKCGVTLLVKLHQLQRDYDINFDSMSNVKLLTNEQLDEQQVNLYEFLAVTHGLITDYSSVAIDYLVVDKPIGFTLDDFEMYNQTRGFVFDDPLEYMPGHHMYNMEDLKQFLTDVSKGADPHKADRERVRKVAINPSSCYCQTVLDTIGL